MQKFSKWIQASPDEPLVDVAMRSLQSRLEPVAYYTRMAAIKASEDIEYVHQMRVWSRRASAAVRLYRKLLPKKRRKWLNRSLDEIRRSAGDARDDDVFSLRLAADREDPRAALVLADVRTQRCSAQRQIDRLYQKMFKSGRFERGAAKLLSKVRIRNKAVADGSICFHEWSLVRYQAEVTAFFCASESDLSIYENLHRFRIAGKQLRYSIELLAPAFGDVLREKAYPLILDLQDRLGEINDHASAVRRLAIWSEHTDDPDQSGYLDELQRHEQQRMAQQRQVFLGWWSGSVVKRLRRDLNAVPGINS